MIILVIASSIPYFFLYFSTEKLFRNLPITILLPIGCSCVLYHILFLYACKKIGYSFLTVTFFFFWIFTGIAPLMCSLTGRWLWGDITFELKNTIIGSSLLCFFFIAVFYICHRFSFRRGFYSKYLLAAGAVSDERLFIGLWSSLGMSICVLLGLGITGTFFRSAYDGYISSGAGQLFIQDFVRPMPAFIGVPMLWVLLKERLAWGLPRTWLAMATVGMALTINFPVSVARFYGWMIIGLFFYYININRAIFRRVWIAGLFILCGFWGSFAADIGRHATSAEEIRENMSVSTILNPDSFFAGHVDAFEMLVYGVDYVHQEGSAMGKQLLGVILFWFPRTSWPEKPIATGELLGSSYINIMIETANTNLSAPLVLEGYINFGIVGVFLFAIIAGIGTGLLDRAIVERKTNIQLNKQKVIYRIDAIAAPLLGLWIYLLRGSLLPAFAYSCAMISSAYLAWALFFRSTHDGADTR